jgi:hypothetical protein
VFIGGSGTDRMEGEHGDDIFVGGEGVDRHEGMTGFDWMSYERDQFGITDLTIRADVLQPPPPSPDAILDRFRQVEGLSGSEHDDELRGILEQIRIAEAHAAGAPLQQLIANPTLSLGLRTVDGSYNNLVHDRRRCPRGGLGRSLAPTAVDLEQPGRHEGAPVENGPQRPLQFGHAQGLRQVAVHARGQRLQNVVPPRRAADHGDPQRRTEPPHQLQARNAMHARHGRIESGERDERVIAETSQGVVERADSNYFIET